ncbi:unnamed protein product [Prunus brigantina]
MLTIRLSDDNYLKWSYQLESVLQGYDLFGYLDGSVLAPPKFAILDEEGVTSEVTAAYKDWLRTDKALLSLLIASLSDEALEYVIGSRTAREAWLNLTDRYASVSRARINHLKTEMQTAQKGGDSIERFLLRLKHIRDQLHSAGVKISDDDFVIAALNGLLQEYDIIKTVLIARDTSISLKDFRAQLLVAEQTAEARGVTHSAMYISQSAPNSHFGPRSAGYGPSSGQGLLPTPVQGSGGYAGSNTRFSGPRPNFNGNSGRGVFGSGKSGSSQFRPSSAGFRNGFSTNKFAVPECQICSKRGHTAANCYHRHSSPNPTASSVIIECQICGKKGHGALDCYHRSNYAFQGQSPPSSLTAMTAQTIYNPDQDKLTKKILLQGKSSQGLYPIPVSLQPSVSKLPAPISPVLSMPSQSTSIRVPLLVPVTTSATPNSVQGFDNLASDPAASAHSISPDTADTSPSISHAVSPSDSIASVLNAHQLQVLVPAISASAVNSSSVSDISALSVPSGNTHPMQTRAKSGISKLKPFSDYQCYHTTIPVIAADGEPSSYRIAAQSPAWVKAMHEELEALQMQGTWSLVPCPSQKNIVGSKWIYKIKRNADGSIASYKARLVAQGFNQQQGLDFSETFSPVVRHTTVRLILSLAAMNKWSLHQLDVKNAFLHGDLEEEVYMRQPPGSDIVILLLYVDDIILTGSSPQLVQTVIDDLGAVFDMKDMGRLAYFLGLQVSYDSTGGIFVHQTKYAQELLNKAGMTNCKACPTPCKPHNQVLRTEGQPLTDPTLYRSLVGALRYLTFTRPDLSYFVNTVCQYMTTPTEAHFDLVKRILRYIQGTIQYGIHFTTGPWHLQAYSDADWAGDLNTRRSTTGFVIFLGNNPISWQSKKQGSVSRSSTEAEYRALANTAADLAWIRQVLLDLKVCLPEPPTISCDNLSALALSSNPIYHSRIKHLDIDFHFVRERVQRNDLTVQYIPTEEQLADVFTKGLHSPVFLSHCANMRLGNLELGLRGNDNSNSQLRVC